MISKVKQSVKKYNFYDILIPILLLILAIIIASNPAKYSAVSLKGLEIWAKVLVPTLLPFFVLTKLFCSCGLLYDVSMAFKPITNKLYKCPPITSYVFFMSIITGYPVGSKLIADLHSSGQLSKGDATKALSFCANSGPMFILGSVAVGMFGNQQMGYIIFISHILGSLLNGLLYRNIKSEVSEAQTNLPAHITFGDSVMQSVSSILLIGGVICFTFVVIEVITSSIVFLQIIRFLSSFGIKSDVLCAIFSGFFEITKGTLLLSSCNLSFFSSCLIATAIISFGGISTFLQSISFTKGIVNNKIFFLQKITHMICATFVCFLILIIFF